MAASANPQPSDDAAEAIEGLSPADHEWMAVLKDVLQEFKPELGALRDFPQLTVGHEHTLEVCRLAKQDPRLGMEQLNCLACVDYKEYFQLVYILHSMEPERTLAIKTDLPYDDPHVPSVTGIWRAAEWYEREAHDLFGVEFDGHPDLSPLLLYEGFEGFPGRKEYDFYDYQEF